MTSPTPPPAPSPVVLRGRYVRLEPMTADHVDDLALETAGDEELWRWLPAYPADEYAMAEVVADALAARDHGDRFPFVLVEQSSGRAVGSSSYLDIAPADWRIEVGWTFVARRLWRTAANTEAKLLLLGHAFDDLGYERVALKTHHENLRSQAAIERLGAVREGVLRHHMRHRDGTWRDSVYYSILSAEWPAARDRLRARLDQA